MFPEYRGEPIVGAFVAITNWSGETLNPNFQVEEVNRLGK
jgi:hypothetical protein